MGNIKINYTHFHCGDLDSPFSLEEVGFDPENLYNLSDKTAVYSKCPSWKHKVTRTFVVRSPVTMELSIDIENARMSSSNLTQNQFDEFLSPTFVPSNWCSKDRVTIQTNIPKIIFWTNNRNIWIESKPHYETTIKNNLTSIPGWFNLSNWPRAISSAFDVVDVNKPVVINRGDILYQLCFYSRNLDDGIILRKEKLPEPVWNKLDKLQRIKTYIPGLSKKFIFRNQPKQCPFKIFHKG